MPPPFRKIKSILIANRGEIAIRILQAVRELPSPPTTYALYTDNDTTHITLGRPDHALKLTSPASYMDTNAIIALVQKHKIDAVHPGYGFLSESPELSKRCWEEAGSVVIGPGWEVLERTGDKLKAKMLAEECGVPVLKAMRESSGSWEDVHRFANSVGYPVMVKAVDGGGGRGIRLVEKEVDLRNAVERCVNESPSRTVFAEQAAVNGFKHIEVQIVGDGRGGVKHLWERDCSVQRRFQKIVEIAPTPTRDRSVVAEVIQSAVKMAEKLQYRGLGTFEYLVSLGQRQYFFLEINPRVQVEHTISETIAGMDLVREQLLIAQDLQEESNPRLLTASLAHDHPPSSSIQLRLCAEDPANNFALSIGKITDIVFPSGNGIRVDSHLTKGGSITPDFDNMMAKIIVTGATWDATLSKARRALSETRVTGVKTNLDLLRAILADETFCDGRADTKWLENNMDDLLNKAVQIGRAIEVHTSTLPALPQTGSAVQGASLDSGIQLRKGDSWTVQLESTNTDSNANTNTTNPPHHLSLNRVIRNNLPETLIADLSFTAPGASPLTFKATLQSTTSSSRAISSTHRRGDANNPRHIVLPMSGRLIEVLVQEGDEVREGDVVAFVKQMKMELEVRSSRSGRVGWILEMDDESGEGEDVAEGVLLCELEEEARDEGGVSGTGRVEERSKL